MFPLRSSFLSLLSLMCALPAVLSLGLTCADHPAYTSGLQGVLIKSWSTLNDDNFPGSLYHVNPTTHQYAPLGDEDSTKYRGLDLFWAYQPEDSNVDQFVRLELQRPAKVYLVVPFDYDGDYPEASLGGWKSEEYVRLVKGADEDIQIGVHQTGEKWVTTEGYAFSKVVDGEVVLPGGEWVKRNIVGGKPIDQWFVLVAEEDGSATKYPQKPTGVEEEIVPMQRCPDELHDLWMTRNTDEEDAETKGIMWPTWHPMWDPCYWCAYDHEHGSSPRDLMGYEPKFGYIAYKNGRESEIHEGFKGVVFKEDKYLVYYMMHGQTSNVNRLKVRHHTITLAVKDTETDELVVEVGHKGDMGFVSARKKGGGVVPLQAVDEEMMKDFEERDVFRQRTVNVIDEGNLRADMAFRDPPDVMRGEYEEWTTNPICSNSGFHGALRMDYTSSISGIRNANDLDGKIELGHDYDGVFIRNDGVGRIFRAREYKMEEYLCMFRLEDIGGGKSVDGVFYTDPFGMKLVGGPGEHSVRQYIKPGFKMTLDGDYEAIESWTGMYEKGMEGRMISYGYSVDPDMN